MNPPGPVELLGFAVAGSHRPPTACDLLGGYPEAERGTDLGVSHLAGFAAHLHWTTSFLACGQCRDALSGLSSENVHIEW
jgi:hypothetical protein